MARCALVLLGFSIEKLLIKKMIITFSNHHYYSNDCVFISPFVFIISFIVFIVNFVVFMINFIVFLIVSIVFIVVFIVLNIVYTVLIIVVIVFNIGVWSYHMVCYYFSRLFNYNIHN